MVHDGSVPESGLKDRSVTRIIYIAGYGRSGSTVLALLLGQAPGVVSLGEVGGLHRALREERRCTCGAELVECDFWGELLRDNGTSETLRDRYCDVRLVMEYARRRSSAAIFVDSTKTAWHNLVRPWRLIRAGYDVRMIHLVRGPGDVFRAARAGKNSEIETGQAPRAPFIAALRALLGWSVANALTLVYAAILGRKYMLLSYKTMTKRTDVALQSIGKLVGRELSDIAEVARGNRPMIVGHEINGNRLLRSGPVFMNRPG